MNYLDSLILDALNSGLQVMVRLYIADRKMPLYAMSAKRGMVSHCSAPVFIQYRPVCKSHFLHIIINV